MRASWIVPALLGLASCLPATPEPKAADEGPPPSRELPLVLSPSPQDARPGGAFDAPSPPPFSADLWTSCYQGFTPGSDVAADLERLTSACGAAARMRAITPIHASAGDEGSQAERLSFRARKGRCYRVFAVGAPAAIDVDVAIYAPDGRLAAGDASRDRFPVVPPRGPLCVRRSGVYTIAASVTLGKGDYLLQIWGTDASAFDDDEDEER